MGHHPAFPVDGEEVGGPFLARQMAGHPALEIEEQRFGPALANRLGDSTSKESRDSIDIGDAEDVGDAAPALLQRLDPRINLVGALAITDEQEQGPGAGKVDVMGGSELVCELEGFDSDDGGFRIPCHRGGPREESEGRQQSGDGDEESYELGGPGNAGWRG